MAKIHSIPATDNATPVAQKRDVLLRQRLWWGDIYHGTAEELVAAGFVTTDMFPGQPGRNKGSQTYPGTPKIQIHRVSKNTFDVLLHASEEEVERRQAQQEKERHAELAHVEETAWVALKARIKRTVVDKTLAALEHSGDLPSMAPPPVGSGRDAHYSDAKAFSKHTEWLLRVFRASMANQMTGATERDQYGDVTIRYDADTIEQVKDALDEAMIALQAATPHQTKRAAALRDAREDPEFRTFLSRLVGPNNQVAAS